MFGSSTESAPHRSARDEINVKLEQFDIPNGNEP